MERKTKVLLSSALRRPPSLCWARPQRRSSPLPPRALPTRSLCLTLLFQTRADQRGGGLEEAESCVQMSGGSAALRGT